MAANIVAVDDENAIRELLQVNLRHAGHEVSACADAESALALVKSAVPDLVLTDWVLPGLSGLALARQLRQESRTRQVSVIMLSGRADERDVLTAFEAGVDDYVTKPFSPRELLARVHAVLRRRAPEVVDDAIEIAGLRLDAGTQRAFARDQPFELTPMEFRLLRFFMTRPERVHTRTQVLDQVWGDHVFIEERTVDVHIRRLRKSLEPAGLHNLIETVRGSGYRFSAAA